jgi:hypothetical protein
LPISFEWLFSLARNGVFSYEVILDGSCSGWLSCSVLFAVCTGFLIQFFSLETTLYPLALATLAEFERDVLLLVLLLDGGVCSSTDFVLASRLVGFSCELDADESEDMEDVDVLSVLNKFCVLFVVLSDAEDGGDTGWCKNLVVVIRLE